MSTAQTVREVYDLACPKCDDDGNLSLVLTVWAALTADGTKPFGEPAWDENSQCLCNTCQFFGYVSQFHTEGAP